MRHRDKKVVGVFVRFRAPASLTTKPFFYLVLRKTQKTT
jgi:hypothetical protein